MENGRCNCNRKFLVETFAETTQEDYESVYKVNVLPLLTTRICLPYAKGSHVVTISSMGGFKVV
jgi:NAD(P)-dependent dehydrogenase (short-subunit alcohol dehydrogenase family)